MNIVLLLVSVGLPEITVICASASLFTNGIDISTKHCFITSITKTIVARDNNITHGQPLRAWNHCVTYIMNRTANDKTNLRAHQLTNHHIHA